jgi:hypothetical protein
MKTAILVMAAVLASSTLELDVEIGDACDNRGTHSAMTDPAQNHVHPEGEGDSEDASGSCPCRQESHLCCGHSLTLFSSDLGEWMTLIPVGQVAIPDDPARSDPALHRTFHVPIA